MPTLAADSGRAAGRCRRPAGAGDYSTKRGGTGLGLPIARRLLRFAVEDIGLADPQALVQALSAWDAYDRLGSPEGELAIAQCVIYLGTAPKSNAAYEAMRGANDAALRRAARGVERGASRLGSAQGLR